MKHRCLTLSFGDQRRTGAGAACGVGGHPSYGCVLSKHIGTGPLRHPTTELGRCPTDLVPAGDTPGGRGGEHHKYLQDLIGRAAKERGFDVVVEKRLLAGHGHVDISLTRGGVSIACEISVSTGVAHELRNILKCVSANYEYVVLVSSEQERLDEAVTSPRDVPPE